MEAICKVDYEKRIKVYNEAKHDKKKVNVPEIGFYDVYGVWFSGKLIDYIRKVAREEFLTEIGDSMHVYVSIDPNPSGESKGITDGIHNILVYGQRCKLYKWMAQGFHRGLIVLADDVGNGEAERFRLSGT